MNNDTLDSPRFADAQSAARRIQPWIHQTPVFTNGAIDEASDCRVFFKCENLQKTGSFKIRGALNAVSLLSDETRSRGVVTHSSGNHAAALAFAARQFGIAAHIVMPSNSSRIKIAAVRHYGGRIIECEPTLAARLSVAATIQTETNAVLIPPFDHPHIIAGQATCAMELLEQCQALDVIIAPIGGGGLMSGTCLAARSISPTIKIIGAEPSGADDAFQSKQKNEFIPQTNPQTIADGLRTSLGELTWPFVRDHVDEIICVNDDEIVAAMKFFCERTKLIIEPSSAVAVAALMKLKRRSDFTSRQVGVILSGGNVDLADLG